MPIKDTQVFFGKSREHTLGVTSEGNLGWSECLRSGRGSLGRAQAPKGDRRTFMAPNQVSFGLLY